MELHARAVRELEFERENFAETHRYYFLDRELLTH